MRKGALLAALIAILLPMAGCGPKAITVGSRPFPAERPVFSDTSGKALRGLPSADGAIRFVFLEFPWCPACADVWRALRSAAGPFPPGTVRVYRVLFGREKLLSLAGRRDVPPLHPAHLPDGDVPNDPGALEVIPLTAFPGEFREEFRLNQGPVLFFLDAEGTVERRWIGFSPNMSRELSSEIRKRSRVPSPRPPGT